MPFASRAQGTSVDDSAPPARKLNWGGAIQLRSETWENFAFLPSADDDFTLGRVQLNADVGIGASSRFFVEAKSSLSTDRDLPGGTRTLDVDTLALQQAYFDFRHAAADSNFRLLVGRQPLAFGRQRLVSPLPWGNTLRAWDGARMTYSSERWTVDGFYTWFAPVDKYDSNSRNRNEPFRGIYARRMSAPNRGIDAYWFRRGSIVTGPGGGRMNEERDTLGLRLYHQSGPWRGDIELTHQSGDSGPFDVNAESVALEGARYWENGFTESVTVGMDYASGDDAGTERLETFDQLYPLAHAYLGYIDIIGRKNIRSGFVRGRFRLPEEVTLEVTALTFSRASADDALYNGGGGQVRSGAAASDNHVGNELDITVSRALGARGRLLVGYSRFSPGNFVKLSGPATATDFGYVQYSATF